MTAIEIAPAIEAIIKTMGTKVAICSAGLYAKVGKVFRTG